MPYISTWMSLRDAVEHIGRSIASARFKPAARQLLNALCDGAVRGRRRPHPLDGDSIVIAPKRWYAAELYSDGTARFVDEPPPHLRRPQIEILRADALRRWPDPAPVAEVPVRPEKAAENGGDGGASVGGKLPQRPAPRKRGRTAKKRDAVVAQMRAQIASGSMTRQQLAEALEKNLKADYGVGRTTARDARNIVLRGS